VAVFAICVTLVLLVDEFQSLLDVRLQLLERGLNELLLVVSDLANAKALLNTVFLYEMSK